VIAGRTDIAPEFNPLFEPELPAAQQPNVVGRVRFGRIAIANRMQAVPPTLIPPSIKRTVR